jgi:glycosyltransferase involved in cell wall biosynthesis
VILGEGPERPALQALAGSLGIAGRVHLPGFAANPFAAMRGARAYLSASNAEGFPNALVEALVLGVPVAATDCDSGPGEILQGRSAAKVSAMTEAPHGILVPTEDERAMAAAIRLLTDDDARGRFAAAAARRALDFDRDSAIRRYGEVVDAALATRDRRPAG